MIGLCYPGPTLAAASGAATPGAPGGSSAAAWPLFTAGAGLPAAVLVAPQAGQRPAASTNTGPDVLPTPARPLKFPAHPLHSQEH